MLLPRKECILKLKYPSDKVKLQAILVLVNYLGKIIPNLADTTSPLRELIKKDVHFMVLPVHIDCFENIKKSGFDTN